MVLYLGGCESMWKFLQYVWAHKKVEESILIVNKRLPILYLLIY